MPAHRTAKLSVAFAATLIAALVLGFSSGEKVAAQDESDCITCHATETPGVVEQWLGSKMSEWFDCSMCHGVAHSTNDDVDKVNLPTPSTCAPCHRTQVEQYREGKHALAWTAMNAIPFVAQMPESLGGADGFKGCSGCHKIGEKTEEVMQDWDAPYGSASCDSCHTRHLFSKAEAQDPRACQLCHIGFDHPQWETWSTAKHGSIWAIEEDSGRTPTCQNCHLPNGTHTNITAWGFLALRAYAEDDPAWQADRETILKALGVLDAQGNPTELLDALVGINLVRTTEEEFMALRNQMTAICGECHSSGFVEQQMNANDDLIRRADSMMAEAIDVVNGLYKDGFLAKPTGWDYAPDLLQFYNTESNIENELFTMFLQYRQRTFVGAIHANPDYTYWYGYASMQKSLQTIKDEAELLRATKDGTSPSSTVGYVALGLGVLALLAGGFALIRRH
ncbi:MAG: cytochrome C [Dehalococcoidia bacterium]|nr:cytochrome C [Dehalococcoidia bacterium]